MIVSFRCRQTERVWRYEHTPAFPPEIVRRARVKLQVLHDADNLNDVRRTPGSRLEALRGDRSGQWSIRVNDQWRICFEWIDGNAHNVEMVDYH